MLNLQKHFINHYTNLNSAEITDDYEIQITSDGVSIQNSQFFQAYNWDTLGTHYFKYLYDTFNSIKEEQAAEYPEKRVQQKKSTTIQSCIVLMSLLCSLKMTKSQLLRNLL